MRTPILAAAFALAVLPDVASSACMARSGDTLAPLVELYTSEGCDSCPPADRWLSAQFPPGTPARAAVLAFHVDYWDRLGWTDRFGSAEHTARQQQAMRANRATFVYTPQVLVQGRDFRGWRRASADAIATNATRAPRASLAIAATRRGDVIEVVVDASRVGTPVPDTVVALAYADSRLRSDVAAGENRGVTLTHDHVVRVLLTQPMQREPASYRFTIERPREAGEHAALVAFVQQLRDGDVLQTVTLDLAGCR